MRVVSTHAVSTAVLLAACSSGPELEVAGQGGATLASPGAGGSFAAGAAGSAQAGSGAVSSPPLIDIGPQPSPRDLGADCDPSWSVESASNALLDRDPAVLARFPLERVLTQIIQTAEFTPAGSVKPTPLELLQRLFETENTATGGTFAENSHCDDAVGGVPTVDCPRAEGKLATSMGLLTQDDPDSFFPVAIVNRFDLMPSNFATCGEYRIVYAKQSGRTDPSNRLFLIFESALPNASRLLSGCRPVAEFWAALQSAPATVVAERLETFFFTGLPSFEPAIAEAQFGDRGGACGYSGACGQVRLGQGMQAPWGFRQFRLASRRTSAPSFEPVPLSSSPRPELFDPALAEEYGESFRNSFILEVPDLAAAEVPRLRVTHTNSFEAIASTVEGPAQPNYAARVAGSPSGAPFVAQITDAIGQPNVAPCPPDDPLSSESILERATAVTCPGCHAPERLLSPGRKLGCGMTWPKSLGEAHIDEQGALSEALTAVFLPHRADVLATYLKACDAEKVVGNLQPAPPDVRVECFVAGTPVTMADGSVKAIERIVAGEEVLTFDETTHALVAGRVQRAVVRPSADHLVSINGELVATDNHPFHTKRGWVRAGELRIGDGLVRVRGLDATDFRPGLEPAEVRELVMQPGTVTTYNLDVAGSHSYFAGGLLVHDRP